MSFMEWKLAVWPRLSKSTQDAILAKVEQLRKDGWTLMDAWIMAASMY